MNSQHCSFILDKENSIITISSVNNSSCKIVINIITHFFKNESKLYYASGLPDNINEIYENIKQFNPYYNEGDSKKFYIRKYPKICINITDGKILECLVNYWVSTIYETREIFITTKKCEPYLLNNLVSNANFQIETNQFFTDYVVCRIQNAPEAENHNTFVLKCDRNYFEKLNHFINDQVHYG